MNKWEDSFKKTSSEGNGNKTCQCSSDQGLFVPNRQLSFIVALLFLLAFSIFMVGYFLGKKKMVEQFTTKVQQEAVADQIYTTMVTTAPFTQEQLTTNTTFVQDNVFSAELVSNNVEQENTDVVEKTSEQLYYAQLIGFGTEKAAQGFVKKLAAKNIETEIKRRVSKTAKGHTSYWYQVVTAPYADKNDLSAVVDKIVKEENIKGACIRNC
jgi:hypothetical protein